MVDEQTTAVEKAKSIRREDGKWSIVTRAPKVDREVTTVIDLHDDSVQTMVGWTSEECVKDAARSSWVIGLQSNIRRLLEGGKTVEEVQAFCDTFKPDVSVRMPSDPIAATLNKFTKMDAEAQAAFMKELKARLAGKK